MSRKHRGRFKGDPVTHQLPNPTGGAQLETFVPWTLASLMRALGLAHHWQRLLDEQRAASVAEIAQAEGMDVTQVRRLLRLTLLAPEVLERLTESPTAVLEHVMRQPWPNGWSDQMRVLAPPA